MVERAQFEQGTNGEPLGLPNDLFSDPGKYDKDIPLWKRTVGFVKQYEQSKSNGRRVLVEQLAGSAIKDLGFVSQLIGNFSLSSAVRPDLDIDEIKDRFVHNLERAVSQGSTAIWTPDKIEQLTQMGLESSTDARPVYQLIQRGIFNKPKTVDEAVNLFYNAAWAMVQTDDFEVKEDLLATLCLEEQDIITPQSRSVWLAEFGLATPNDVTFSKYSAFSRALRSVGILLEGMTNSSTALLDSSRYKARSEKMGLAYKDLSTKQKDEIQKIVLEFKRQNPQRVKQLITRSGDQEYPLLFQSITASSFQDGKIQAALEKRRLAPQRYDNLVIDTKDPLQCLISEKISPYIMQLHVGKSEADLAFMGHQKLLERRIELPQGLELQVFAQGTETPEQRAELVAEVYSVFSAGKVINPSREMLNDPHEVIAYASQHLGLVGFFDRDRKIIFALQRPLPTERLGALGGVLEYHRPTITLKQLGIVNEQIKKLRQDLVSRFTKGVGKRGYEVAFADPALRQFGYESILFKQNPDNRRIKATIVINGQPYEFGLDSGYRILLGGEHLRKFKSPLDQAWLELLTLTHLKKLVCTGEDEEELKHELLSGEKQYGLYRRQQVHRIEHLRKQSPGRDFSTEAFQKCLKGHLPMKNLLELNRLRASINWGGTKETGIWTYVSGVEKDLDIQAAKPVKVAFAKATEDMRQVLSLRQISSEEIARLEKEIMGELENL